MDKNVEYVIDYLDDRIAFNQPVEIPEEYTLVVRSNDDFSNKIEVFSKEASEFDDKHRYYDRNSLHATIYAPISTITSIDDFRAFLTSELAGKDLEFEVAGISSSVIVVRPTNFSLIDLRHRIATFLNDTKRFERDPIMESMTWMTFLRFKDKPNDQYYKFIASNRARFFGIFRPKSIDLYKTNKRILDESTEKIFSIKL